MASLEDRAAGYIWRLIQNPLYRGEILNEAMNGLEGDDLKSMFFWLFNGTLETIDQLLETHQDKKWYLDQIEAQSGIAEVPTTEQ